MDTLQKINREQRLAISEELKTGYEIIQEAKRIEMWNKEKTLLTEDSLISTDGGRWGEGGGWGACCYYRGDIHLPTLRFAVKTWSENSKF